MPQLPATSHTQDQFLKVLSRDEAEATFLAALRAAALGAEGVALEDLPGRALTADVKTPSMTPYRPRDGRRLCRARRRPLRGLGRPTRSPAPERRNLPLRRGAASGRRPRNRNPHRHRRVDPARWGRARMCSFPVPTSRGPIDVTPSGGMITVPISISSISQQMR